MQDARSGNRTRNTWVGDRSLEHVLIHELKGKLSNQTFSRDNVIEFLVLECTKPFSDVLAAKLHPRFGRKHWDKRCRLSQVFSQPI